MQFIRMLVDADGAPHGHTVHHYEAGELYSVADTEPQMSEALMHAFVASGRAVEVDASGNPLVAPAAKRATKKNDAPATDTPTDAPDAPAVSEPTEPTE